MGKKGQILGRCSLCMCVYTCITHTCIYHTWSLSGWKDPCGYTSYWDQGKVHCLPSSSIKTDSTGRMLETKNSPREENHDIISILAENRIWFATNINGSYSHRALAVCLGEYQKKGNGSIYLRRGEITIISFSGPFTHKNVFKRLPLNNKNLCFFEKSQIA